MTACESCGDLHDPSDMVNSLEDFYFCYTCEDKDREKYDYMSFTRYSHKAIREDNNE